MSKAKINIIGACTSRDIFGITNMDRDDSKSYKIQSYIWNISPLFLFEKNLNIDEAEFIEYREKFKSEMKADINDFCARRVLSSLKKNIFEISDFENCDFLIIDNFFCNLSYFELEDGTVISYCDTGLLNYLIANKVIPPIKRRFYFDDIKLSLKEEMIKRFCLMVKRYIDEAKIILIEYRPANIVFNNEYNQSDTFSKPNIYKKLLENNKWTALILRENLKDSLYICPPAVTIADQNHKWNQSFVHYLPEYYYNYYMPAIDCCIENSNISVENGVNDKESKEKNIRRIKRDFDSYIISKYGKEIRVNKIHDFNKIYINNKTFEIFSYHKTKIFFNTGDLSIINSKICKPQYKQLYAKIDNDKVMLYIIANNKIFYIKEITFYAKAYLSENQTWLSSIIHNNDNTISIGLYDRFLSSRPDGTSCFMPWNRAWEHLSLREI